MKYRTFNLVVDVIDNSMSPALIKGDTVAVRPSFKAENGHIVTKLYRYSRNTPYPNFIVTAKPAKRKNETEVMK